jgi:hypothetical protein
MVGAAAEIVQTPPPPAVPPYAGTLLSITGRPFVGLSFTGTPSIEATFTR